VTNTEVQQNLPDDMDYLDFPNSAEK